MNNIKHNIIKTPYAGILESISYSSIQNALVGSCNLYAEHLNDYSSDGINDDVATFLYDNAAHMDQSDIKDILDNPDVIIQNAACEFEQAVIGLFDNRHDDVSSIMKHANVHFDSWGSYYLFADPVSNACSNWFIIRAENEQEAYSWVVTKFENMFITEEPDHTDDEEYTERNDNGNPINTDNLQLVGSFSFTK